MLVGGDVGVGSSAVHPSGRPAGELTRWGALGDRDQLGFVLGRGHAGQGPDLGAGEAAGGERVRGRAQGGRRLAGADPLAGGARFDIDIDIDIDIGDGGEPVGRGGGTSCSLDPCLRRRPTS
jgi:hypothetical protein